MSHQRTDASLSWGFLQGKFRLTNIRVGGLGLLGRFLGYRSSLW